MTELSSEPEALAVLPNAEKKLLTIKPSRGKPTYYAERLVSGI